MGAKPGKTAQKDKKMSKDKRSDEVNRHIKTVYLRGEFQAMDMQNDKKLSLSEFTRLLTLLQHPHGGRAAKEIWKKKLHKPEGEQITEEDYVNLMLKEKDLEKKTNVWRKMYAMFDTDKTGWASKQDVEKGLREMFGTKLTEELKDKVRRMDENKDGKIYYLNFLRMQLGMIKD